MRDRKNIGDTITYQKQMTDAYANQLEWEHTYRIKLHREEIENKSKLRVFRVLTIALGIFDVVCLITMGSMEMMKPKVPTVDELMAPSTTEMAMSAAAAIIYMFALIGLIFGGIAFLFCLWRFIYYRKRRTMELDNRDGKWRTYEEMREISSAMTVKITHEREDMLVELEKNMAIVQKNMQDYLEGRETPEPERIEMDELRQVQEEKKNEKQEVVLGNPLEKTWW